MSTAKIEVYRHCGFHHWPCPTAAWQFRFVGADGTEITRTSEGFSELGDVRGAIEASHPGAWVEETSDGWELVYIAREAFISFIPIVVPEGVSLSSRRSK